MGSSRASHSPRRRRRQDYKLTSLQACNCNSSSSRAGTLEDMTCSVQCPVQYDADLQLHTAVRYSGNSCSVASRRKGQCQDARYPRWALLHSTRQDRGVHSQGRGTHGPFALSASAIYTPSRQCAWCRRYYHCCYCHRPVISGCK